MIVRTAAGLDSLAEKTVVLDKDGDAWQKRGGEWFLPGSQVDTLDAEEYGPFRTMRVVDPAPAPSPETIQALAEKHFGNLSLLSPDMREAYYEVVRQVYMAGATGVSA